MIERNPFKVFSPAGAKYLILGSFVAKDSKAGVPYDWYYSNGRNQFWLILEEVYGIELNDKKKKQELFSNLGIAIGDIILECERLANSSMDSKLKITKYNISAIARVLKNNEIKKIMFTSRFVEKHFKRHFKELIGKYPSVKLLALPSPSPRYALMSKKEKIRVYKREFPKIGSM